MHEYKTLLNHNRSLFHTSRKVFFVDLIDGDIFRKYKEHGILEETSWRLHA